MKSLSVGLIGALFLTASLVRVGFAGLISMVAMVQKFLTKNTTNRNITFITAILIINFVAVKVDAADGVHGNDDQNTSDSKQLLEQHNEEVKECSECCICLENVESNDEKAWQCSKCNEKQHAACVEIWFKEKKTCPHCRKDCRTPLEKAQDIKHEKTWKFICSCLVVAALPCIIGVSPIAGIAYATVLVSKTCYDKVVVPYDVSTCTAVILIIIICIVCSSCIISLGSLGGLFVGTPTIVCCAYQMIVPMGRANENGGNQAEGGVEDIDVAAENSTTRPSSIYVNVITFICYNKIIVALILVTLVAFYVKCIHSPPEEEEEEEMDEELEDEDQDFP